MTTNAVYISNVIISVFRSVQFCITIIWFNVLSMLYYNITRREFSHIYLRSSSNMATNRSSSAVADFYRNKNIFITGGTGFLGLAVIEKTLRSLEVSANSTQNLKTNKHTIFHPQIGNIYVLMRAKKGKSIAERLVELTKNEIFETLLTNNTPDIFKKLVPIEGDVSAEQLGISPADRSLLQQNVHVVIHSAATLDFNETLKSTVVTNLLGTRRVMQLSAECRHLCAVVHVSSAYVNSQLMYTEEILYPEPSDCGRVEEMVRTLSEEELVAQTPALLGDHPNTYTFTKHFAEHEVNKYAKRFPCGIVRPSMSELQQ